MSNFEWIKSLDKDQIAGWLANHECINTCAYADSERDCVDEDFTCFSGIREWLDMEVDEKPSLNKGEDIENYADRFISEINEAIFGLRLNYKEVVKQVAKKMLEKVE